VRAAAKAPSKAAIARRANKALAEWKAAKPALRIYSLARGTYTIELNGLETKSEMNQRGSHWSATNRKAKQRREVSKAFLVLRARLPRAAGVPTSVVMVRVGEKPLDRLVNLPSAFKAIEDEVCKQFGVDDGPGCPIKFSVDQKPGDVAGVELILTWGEAGW
jgi:hypothetical protein